MELDSWIPPSTDFFIPSLKLRNWNPFLAFIVKRLFCPTVIPHQIWDAYEFCSSSPIYVFFSFFWFLHFHWCFLLLWSASRDHFSLDFFLDSRFSIFNVVFLLLLLRYVVLSILFSRLIFYFGFSIFNITFFFFDLQNDHHFFSRLICLVILGSRSSTDCGSRFVSLSIMGFWFSNYYKVLFFDWKGGRRVWRPRIMQIWRGRNKEETLSLIFSLLIIY